MGASRSGSFKSDADDEGPPKGGVEEAVSSNQELTVADGGGKQSGLT